MENNSCECVSVLPFALQVEAVEAEGQDLAIPQHVGEAGVLGGEERGGDAVWPDASTQQPVPPVLRVQH